MDQRSSHDGPVSSIDSDADRRLFVTGGLDGDVKLSVLPDHDQNRPARVS